MQKNRTVKKEKKKKKKKTGMDPCWKNIFNFKVLFYFLLVCLLQLFFRHGILARRYLIKMKTTLKLIIKVFGVQITSTKECKEIGTHFLIPTIQPIFWITQLSPGDEGVKQVSTLSKMSFYLNRLVNRLKAQEKGPLISHR